MDRRRASAAPALNVERPEHVESVKNGRTKKRFSIDAITAKLRSKFSHRSTPSVSSLETGDDGACCTGDHFRTPSPRDRFDSRLENRSPWTAPPPPPARSRDLDNAVAPWHSKKEKRSQSLTAPSLGFRASSTPALAETDESKFRKVARKDSREYYRRRMSHQLFASTSASPYTVRSGEVNKDWWRLQTQMQIYRAKSEAKTVSVIDGGLYINYEYVGPLPDGCIV